MPQHPRSRGRRRGQRPSPAPPAAVTPDPAAPVRLLVQAGIITAAALDARDDLATAAVSLYRLGRLTLGMWRALSRELTTAAERLDRQAQDYLDDLHRRAQALQVAPDAALAAGVAAGHLEEHRATLETCLSTLEQDARRLAVPDILLGFLIEGPLMLEDDEGDEDLSGGARATAADAGGGASGVESSLAVRVRLFLWPAPFSPAGVTIAPQVADTGTAGPDQSVGMEVDVEVAPLLAGELATTCGVPAERLPGALSELAMACWTAHQLDERNDEDDEDEELAADDEDDD